MKDPLPPVSQPPAQSPPVPPTLTADDIVQTTIDWAALTGNTLTGTRYSLTVTKVTTKVEDTVTLAVFDGEGSGILTPTREDGCLANFSRCENGMTIR